VGGIFTSISISALEQSRFLPNSQGSMELRATGHDGMLKQFG